MVGQQVLVLFIGVQILVSERQPTLTQDLNLIVYEIRQRKIDQIIRTSGKSSS